MPVEKQQTVSPPPYHWKVSSTSVCGSSHEKLNLPCQDASHWMTYKNDILLAAVADGAGSAPQGDKGAQIAVETAIETLGTELHLIENLENTQKVFSGLLKKALKASLQAIKKEAKTQEIKPRELASTLIIAIATPQCVATAQIGDGAAVIKTQTDELIALTTPDSGEYINQTTFLISPNAIKTAQINVYEGDITHLALFSDGLQMLALQMPYGKPHAPFFAPLFQFITKAGKTAQAQLTSFLKSPRVRTRTDDDLTLLLAALIHNETENEK